MPHRTEGTILFAPVGDLVPVALRNLARGGTLALAGIYMTPIPRLDFSRLNLYVGLMILVPIVSGRIGVGQSYLNNLIGQHVMQDLRLALYSHLQRMPPRFFTETKTGGEALLREAARVRVRLATTEFPLEVANQALELLKVGAISGTGVLLTDDGFRV